MEQRVPRAGAAIAAEPRRMARGSAALRLAALAVGVALAALLLHRLWLARYGSLAEAAQAVAAMGRHPAAAPAFAVLYAAAATVALPITPFTLAAGAVFGFWTGLVVSLVGSLGGALAGYTVARLAGRTLMDRLLGARRRTLDRICGCTSRAAHFRRRLIIVIPFALLNYAGGLARMPLRDFVVATMLGTFPSLLVYVYFAHALVAGARRAQRSALLHVALASVLLLAVSFLPAIMRRLGWREEEN